MIRRPPRSTQSRSSAASDVYKRQPYRRLREIPAPDRASFHRASLARSALCAYRTSSLCLLLCGKPFARFVGFAIFFLFACLTGFCTSRLALSLCLLSDGLLGLLADLP